MASHGRANDQTPLLPKDSDGKNIWNNVRLHLKHDLTRDWADLPLIFLYFSTGLIDSSSISTWGSFVSMQTGNTVYLGLGIANPEESNRWLKALVSIGFFLLGSFCFSSFHRWGSPLRRWVFVSSFLFQGICVIATAILVTLDIIDAKTLRWPNVLSIGLLSFQAAGSAIASRQLQYNELPTVVLTSVYCDLAADPLLFTAKFSEDPKRNRRAIAIVVCLCGAICGGLFAKSAVGLAGALWVSVAIKLIVSVIWYLWAPVPQELNVEA
ncbi:hypothetical protein EV356DRAFT_454679 [Viridothelium virens]|uniref:DUF1275 domain protein n=1 Tax=Viridothelium virens TaxID=1048519 RepID=A0A6A6GWU1_VIRVR|nr:hypothetical protein EV356DRAFT_454679 [Viridothelium virens]